MAGSMTMATSQIALGNQLADSDPPAQAIDSPVPIYSFILGYSPNANIISAQDSANGNWSYSYDEFNACSPVLRKNFIKHFQTLNRVTLS
jgi:hypothetical protein